MRTTEQIISDLYMDKRIDELITTLVIERDREDFKQELFVKLLGWKEDWKYSIQELDENGGIFFYVVRSAIRLAREANGIYQSLYVRPSRYSSLDACANIAETEYSEDEENEYIKSVQDILYNVDKAFNKRTQFPFYSKLIEGLVRAKSMRNLSRQTGIPISTISKSVRKIRAHIKKSL